MRIGDANWPRDALPRGTDLHGYRLEGIIGRGGFGITYRAVDGIDQVFAIKECFPRQFAVRQGTEVLPADAGDAEPLGDCLVRFTKEAKALRQISSIGDAGDGVVGVVTFFQTNRTAYLVMEYVSGRSLDALIKDAPQGIDDATLNRILAPLLRALGSVHEAGLLHRDIKPANILLREDGTPVLIDFGAARGTTQGRTVTYTQIFSEGYAPIEQFAGAQQGPFTDIYALGATLYRTIGGKTVDAFTRHQAVLNGQPDPRIPATEIGAGRYGSRLLTMIDAAMIVVPEQRPQSVQALLQMLGDKSGSDDVTVRLPPQGRRVGVGSQPVRESKADAEVAEALRVGRRRADGPGASGMAAKTSTPADGRRRLSRMSSIIALVVLGMVVVLGSWAGVRWLRTESELARAPSEAERGVADAKIAARAVQAQVEAKAAAEAAAEKAAAEAAARKVDEEKAAIAAALEKAAADRAEIARKAAAAEAAAAEAAPKQAAEDKAAEAASRAAAAEASAKAAAAEAAAKTAAEEKAASDRARRAEADRAAAEAAAAKATARTAARRAAEAAPTPHPEQSLAAQAPPAKSAYFAIARAPEKNYLVYSSQDQPTQEIADEAALQKCISANGSGCSVYVRGYDQCVAFAFGSSFFTSVHSAWKQDADLSVARSTAQKTCSDLHFGQCEIIASFCSKGQ